MPRERKLLRKLFAVLLITGTAFIILTGCSSKTTEPNENTEAVVEQSVLEGFPPPIPHTLQDKGQCLVCHGEGEVGTATKVTHPQLTNCRQCHVRGRVEE